MDRALRYAGLVLVIVMGYYISRLTLKPVVEYVQVPGPVVQFDSTGWVRESQLITNKQALDSVYAINRKLAQEISRNKQTIVQLSEISVQLRLEKDSLFTLVNTFTVTDTTVIYQTTYTDSLFMVQSNIDIKDDVVTYSNDLLQLRPLVFTTVMTQKDDKVYFYVESKDFKELNIETFTTIQKHKNPRLLWLGSGLAAGIIGWELIR
jgi:hypothetical protein